jgi:hypothetical protein
MTTRFAKTKKLAGLTILAAAMSAAGLGFGSATAQANPMHPCTSPHMMFCTHFQNHVQRIDNQFDRIQGVFGVGEGTRFDKAVDRFFGVK